MAAGVVLQMMMGTALTVRMAKCCDSEVPISVHASNAVVAGDIAGDGWRCCAKPSSNPSSCGSLLMMAGRRRCVEEVTLSHVSMAVPALCQTVTTRS